MIVRTINAGKYRIKHFIMLLGTPYTNTRVRRAKKGPVHLLAHFVINVRFFLLWFGCRGECIEQDRGRGGVSSTCSAAGCRIGIRGRGVVVLLVVIVKSAATPPPRWWWWWRGRCGMVRGGVSECNVAGAWSGQSWRCLYLMGGYMVP